MKPFQFPLRKYIEEVFHSCFLNA